MKILLFVTPDFNLNATTNFIDPFRAANYLDGQTHFSWAIVSASGGSCKASNGLTVETSPLDIAVKSEWQFVIVSSSWAPETHNTSALQTALRSFARRGSTMGGLDTGAFIIAKAGLLNGKRVTVHYEHIDAMAELYPQTQVTEELYVFDGNAITCCGGTASTDFALQIIKSTHGIGLANAAARYVFHQSLREPSTLQITDHTEPLGNPVPSVIRQVIKIMEDHLEETISIPQICKLAGISQRHLDRLFSKYVKKTPALYYRDIRLDRARGLVTQTDMPFSQVAVASGFSSQVHFSRAYKQRFGLPARQDRIEGRIPFEYRSWPMHKNKL